MSKSKDNDVLLARLGDHVGLPDLCFDDDGNCLLSFDNEVVFIRSEDEETIVLYTPLLEVSPEKKQTVQDLLLDANYLGRASRGGTLAMRRDSSFVVLSLRAKTAWFNINTFVKTLEEFIKTSDFWRQELQAFAGQTDTVTHDTEPQPISSNLRA